MTKPLAIVEAPNTPATRAAHLLHHARAEARDHIGQTMVGMGDVARAADAIAAGGEIYPPGVRDEMRRLADHLQAVADRVGQIMDRNP